ncbi:MAG: hypothetical protein AAF721_00250 [Myxococcota bacterium]
MKRCPKCHRRLWVIQTRTECNGAYVFVQWDVCEYGCPLDPPDTGEFTHEPYESTLLPFDAFAESREQADRQSGALDRGLWLRRFRDYCLRLFFAKGDHAHIRRARRIESVRRAWVFERVRPTLDLDVLGIELTSTERIAWSRAPVSWAGEIATVGWGRAGRIEGNDSHFRTDRLVAAVRGHHRSGIPFAVGPAERPVGGRGANVVPPTGPEVDEAFGGKAGR